MEASVSYVKQIKREELVFEKETIQMDLDLGEGSIQNMTFCTPSLSLQNSHRNVLSEGEFLTQPVCLAGAQLLVISLQPPVPLVCF